MATNEHKTFQQATAHKQPRFPRAANRMQHASSPAFHPTIPLQFQRNPQNVLAAQSLIGNRAVVQLLRQQPSRDTQTTNNTRLPEPLKTNMESLSGIDLSEVQVHYHSEKPAQLQALAYAQAEHIYLGAGQERHLPHEAWHVVQQKQGRVKPTLQMKNGISVNDNPALEKEATQWGEKAIQRKYDATAPCPFKKVTKESQAVQCVTGKNPKSVTVKNNDDPLEVKIKQTEFLKEGTILYKCTRFEDYSVDKALQGDINNIRGLAKDKPKKGDRDWVGQYFALDKEIAKGYGAEYLEDSEGTGTVYLQVATVKKNIPLLIMENNEYGSGDITGRAKANLMKEYLNLYPNEPLIHTLSDFNYALQFPHDQEGGKEVIMTRDLLKNLLFKEPVTIKYKNYSLKD
ncbi:DUF4157 domain-containing protein [Candidatus Regiella endosymbiont of Tuberolachnus salignus]|uniref:eCIS core domain-containing protein n=1 Tax=Candidatus Regiella endosymbiont of Tuberolachnus salignus TaxID=3077956 RepID=UPI0030D2D6AB